MISTQKLLEVVRSAHTPQNLKEYRGVQTLKKRPTTPGLVVVLAPSSFPLRGDDGMAPNRILCERVWANLPWNKDEALGRDAGN